MFPATPTPLPPAGTPQVIIEASNWRIWRFADEAIMVWQQGKIYHADLVVQLGIILIIIIAFVYLTRKWLQGISNEGEL